MDRRIFAIIFEQTKSRSDNSEDTLFFQDSLPAVGIWHLFLKKPFFAFQNTLLKMDTSNTDDLLDYLKLDPDHHEKIASLIPQVTLDLEVWQQLSIGK